MTKSSKHNNNKNQDNNNNNNIIEATTTSERKIRNNTQQSQQQQHHHLRCRRTFGLCQTVDRDKTMLNLVDHARQRGWTTPVHQRSRGKI
jgi:hypothetical protein